MATMLLNFDFILLRFSDFFCGMCPANSKQLLTLILFLEILTKLCVSFSLFLYYKLLSNVKFYLSARVEVTIYPFIGATYHKQC